MGFFTETLKIWFFCGAKHTNKKNVCYFKPKISQRIFVDRKNFVKVKFDNFRKNIFFPEGLIFMKSSIRWKVLHRYFLKALRTFKEFPERYGKSILKIHNALLENIK